MVVETQCKVLRRLHLFPTISSTAAVAFAIEQIATKIGPEADILGIFAEDR
jgi:hypothetical protein